LFIKQAFFGKIQNVPAGPNGKFPRMYELLHFGYVAEWESFRGVVIYQQLFIYEDSLPKQFCFHPCFTIVDCGHVWKLIKGYINKLFGETPNDLRMGIPAPTTNFVGISVILTKTQRKVAINETYQYRQNTRKLEEWLEMQPRCFVMMGINPDSCNAVVWVTSQLAGAMNNWWLVRKRH
jgi:hypothetical protein